MRIAQQSFDVAATGQLLSLVHANQNHLLIQMPIGKAGSGGLHILLSHNAKVINQSPELNVI
jgi:hypothetical protein